MALPEAGEISDGTASRWVRFLRKLARTADFFRERAPDFWTAFTPALIVAALVYLRNPVSNYIFDEQEALLANPYVNGSELPFLDAFRRDFWGLPAGRSIGSYRPLPSLIWRALWNVSTLPWLHHWVNVMVHAANAALLASLVFRWTGQRGAGWLAGTWFLLSAVLTEAVTGVVGLADVLVGFFVLFALRALALPLGWMPFAVFCAVLLACLSKESVLGAIPLVPWVALLTASFTHRAARRWVRGLVALFAAGSALVAYTYFRRHFFPVSASGELGSALPEQVSWIEGAVHRFLEWFRQPSLPEDPINNPLVNADFAERVAGALRVYARGFSQTLFPWTLSADYSYRQEPIPERLVFAGSVAGALLITIPPLLALAAGGWSIALSRRALRAGVDARPSAGPIALMALGLSWFPITYFPHSNILVLLPTVRAERFWYLPVIGIACLVAGLVTKLWPRLGPGWSRVAACFLGALLLFQAAKARWHALDYNSDLVFWRATREASPMSAKAHLNYSVMVGARGRLEERLAINQRALELAPKWPMAHVYQGDALCRLKRSEEAWPHYVRGFELAPNNQSLIALGLQCQWDQGAIEARREELLALASKHRGTWLAYLANDIVVNGKKHSGVDPQYRPRGYAQGPKH